MRVVLDTNVLIAAFIAHGVCNELLEHCALNHEIVLSPFILHEFRDRLLSRFGFTNREVGAALRLLESRGTVVEPKELDAPVCRDPDDDAVIGTAIAGSCRCIVSGDRDLLDLGSAEDIPIVAPSAFWQFENR